MFPKDKINFEIIKQYKDIVKYKCELYSNDILCATLKLNRSTLEGFAINDKPLHITHAKLYEDETIIIDLKCTTETIVEKCDYIQVNNFTESKLKQTFQITDNFIGTKN